MQEKDRIIKFNSPLYEEFALDEIPEDLFADVAFDDDCPPCTSVHVDCCGSTSPSSITINPCDISTNKDIKSEITCQGRLLTIRVILKCVCPNRNIAIGVILFQGDRIRGFEAKEITTPPLPTGHPGENCEHVVVCKFCFVLPGSICCPLTLTPKVIAHYTGFNITPCSEDCPDNLPGKCCP